MFSDYCDNCKIELKNFRCKECKKLYCLNCMYNYNIKLDCPKCEYLLDLISDEKWKENKKNNFKFIKNLFIKSGIGCSKWFK